MLKKNIKFLNLFKKPLLKKNIMGFKQSAGRNSSGKITIRHRGGGHKKKLRKINFNRELNSIIGIVVNIEYDPNRNTFISCVYDFSLKNQFLTAIWQTCECQNNVICNQLYGLMLKYRLALQPRSRTRAGAALRCRARRGRAA